MAYTKTSNSDFAVLEHFLDGKHWKCQMGIMNMSQIKCCECDKKFQPKEWCLGGIGNKFTCLECCKKTLQVRFPNESIKKSETVVA